MTPRVESFFDEATNTITYVVIEPQGKRFSSTSPNPISGRFRAVMPEVMVWRLR